MKPSSPPGWETIASRVNWLLEEKFGGNRSKMGKAIGMTHAAVSRAASGLTAPGARMTSLIVEKLSVNAAWLLHGQGEPFGSERNRKSLGRGTPVSNALLSGVPQTQQSQLSAATLDVLSMLSPTQYWFRVSSQSPLLSRTGRGFQLGDSLLMEADRNLFPPQTTYWERLSVVKLSAEKKPECVLADVSYFEACEGEGDERLQAEVLKFEVDTKTIEEIVLRRSRDGKFKIRQRSRRRSALAEAHEILAITEMPITITAKQIVGVWTGILYRVN